MTGGGDIPPALWPRVLELHGVALGIGLCWPQDLPVPAAVPLLGDGIPWLTLP